MFDWPGSAFFFAFFASLREIFCAQRRKGRKGIKNTQDLSG
jgi:hypothetical protein